MGDNSNATWWKYALAILGTLIVTLMTMWFSIIKDHQHMCGTVNSIRGQQSKVWEKLGKIESQHGKKLVALETARRFEHPNSPELPAVEETVK